MYSDLQTEHGELSVSLTASLTTSITAELQQKFEEERAALLESNTHMADDVATENATRMAVLEQKIEELEYDKAALETNHAFIVQALEREKAEMANNFAKPPMDKDLMEVGQAELK